MLEWDVKMLFAGARTVASGLRRPSLPPDLIGAIACLLDLAAISLGLWFAMLASSVSHFHSVGSAALAATVAVVLASAIWLFGGYRLTTLLRFWRGTLMLLFPALVAWSIGVTPLGALSLVAVILPARALGASIAAEALDFGLTERRAVIIGGGEHCERVISDLMRTPGNDIRVCGIFDDRDGARSPPVVVGVPKLGTLDAQLDSARAAEIDMLIICI